MNMNLARQVENIAILNPFRNYIQVCPFNCFLFCSMTGSMKKTLAVR